MSALIFVIGAIAGTVLSYPFIEHRGWMRGHHQTRKECLRIVDEAIDEVLADALDDLDEVTDRSRGAP